MWEGQGYNEDFRMPDSYKAIVHKKVLAVHKTPKLVPVVKKVIPKPVVHKTPKKVVISNFPTEVLLANVSYSHEDFSKSIERIGFTNLRIYVDHSQSFNITLRNIFTNTDIKHYRDAYRWEKGPDLSFWPQMLNFVTWCATGGCGIAEDMISRKDNIGGFLRFHVAFTVRRLLFEMTCPLSNDSAFDPVSLKYNKAAAERIKNEIRAPGDSASSTRSGGDFRYTHGSNNGLGDICATDGKKVHISWGSMKPDPEIEARNNRFPGGSYDFDKPYQRIGFIYNPLSKDAWKYFIPSEGKGLTAPGLARLNRSIEAFVYCILGAQVNTRSSIVGKVHGSGLRDPYQGPSGSAQETRQEFLVLFESAVIENDISKSIQRYQLAVQNAKQRLDFAISPGCWLFPSNLVINTGSIPGYNNKLQKVTKDMKFGINDVNQEMHKSIPHFVEKPKKHLQPPIKTLPRTVRLREQPQGAFRALPTIHEKETLTIGKREDESHTFLKIWIINCWHRSGILYSEMNPYVSGVDCVYTTYTGEKKYGDGAPGNKGHASWTDVTGNVCEFKLQW